jgi:hypothetical protein
MVEVTVRQKRGDFGAMARRFRNPSSMSSGAINLGTAAAFVLRPFVHQVGPTHAGCAD